MVNHTQRFRLGITLIVFGLILALVAASFWEQHGGLLTGLLALLGMAALAYGVRLLRHKRSL
ncbi:hypothetical protein Q0M94_07385 [Deinococcus radiomollis]|uniref:hypothetical protein n=1 Tax=Deinococcus radiomollis TaxID=468916 RepID=UPI003891D5F1